MADLWELSPGLSVYLLIFAALLGSVWASFSGCAASRMKNGESFLKGRSHCDSCGHVLKPLDLVPIFSWLFAKGRCRYCKAKIPASCPVTEALGAASFVLILWRYGLTLLGLRNLIFTAILILISLIDWETGLIPDSLILASLASFLLFTGFISGWHGIWTGLVGGLMLGVPLLLLVLLIDRVLKRESMGGGDLKLFFAVGLYFPWRELLLVVILSCITGLLLALLTRKTTGDPENPKAFPFAPSIALAAVASLLWAGPIVNWYLNLF